MKNVIWFLMVLLSACTISPLVGDLKNGEADLGTENSPKVSKRWYTTQQVNEGKLLFAATCAACHGREAQGLAEDWKQVDENGNYPPPPLDGSAHAWHHSLDILKEVIEEGGASVGGVMPGFRSVYSDEQIESLIASFQSRWSDKTYKIWQERNQ